MSGARAACVIWAFALALSACTYDPELDAYAATESLGVPAPGGPPLPVERRRVTILHTNDWQSHMLGNGPNADYTPEQTNDDSTVGGVARLKTLVDELRDGSEDPVLLYDGGDWMAGTLFQLLNTSHAPELQMMEAIGYDAVTIGNHDFDWGPNELGRIINRANNLGVRVPIVCANLEPALDDPDDDILEGQIGWRIERARLETLDNGVLVGVFGLLGNEAAGQATHAPTVVMDDVSVAKELVPQLRSAGAELIVALTHNGIRTSTTDPSGYSQTYGDLRLLQEVDGIDVIVGGHSHTPLHEYVVADNGTIIVQAGTRTEWLGELNLVEGEGGWQLGGWEVEGYNLHAVDDSIPGDPDIIAQVDEFIADLRAGPLMELEIGFDDPVAEIPDVAEGMGDDPDNRDIDMYGWVSADAPCRGESELGNLVTDAYVYGYDKIYADEVACAACGGICDACGLDLAFDVNGSLRTNILFGNTGHQALSDVFRVLSLGLDPDGGPGYPMTDFYLTPDEVKLICEVGVDVDAGFSCVSFIEYSEQLRCTVDMTQVAGQRVTKMEIDHGDGFIEYYPSLDPAAKALLHVQSNIWHHTFDDMLGMNYHLLFITPKDEFGDPYDMSCEASLESAAMCGFITDAKPSTPKIEFYKPWNALVDYMRDFPDTDGDTLPNVPDRYAQPQGRLINYFPL